MKILIITPVFPYPLETGGNKAQFLMIDKLRELHEISLICPKTNSENLKNLGQLWSNVELNVFETVSDTPIKKTGFVNDFSLRLSNLLKHPSATIKRKLGLLPKSQPAAIDWPNRDSMVYTNINIMNVDDGFLSYVEEKIKYIQYDIIQVEFINFISLGFVLPEASRKLFIHHELGYVRTAREMATLTKKSIKDQYLYEINKAFEIESLKRYNGVITFSDVDKVELEKNLNIPVYNSPFSVIEEAIDSIDNFKIEKLIFLGGESHYPNVDALNWFIRSFYTQNGFKIPIQIIGKWSKPFIDYYKEMEQVEFLGFVDDLSHYLKNSAMIVPLRIGSGIRTKILEAFSWGVPIISTSIGIEGIPAIDGKHYYRADTIEEMKIAIKRIIENPAKTIKMIKEGQSDVVPQYSIEKCSDVRNSIYNRIFNL